MGRRIAVYGATDEALQLLPLLTARDDLEVVAVFDPQAAVHRRRLALLEPRLAAALQRLLRDDPRVLTEDPALEVVIDAGIAPPFRTRFAQLAARGLEVITPLSARLLWGAPANATDPKRELLQALEEIAASVDLAATPDALFARLLDVSVAVTGAAGGSLLLRDPDEEVLCVRAAVGLEAELWPKVRVRLGEGIAGRVWAEGRALVIRGRANPELFELARERFDVSSALIVPLHRGGSVCGILSLHHPTRSDLFGDGDLEFGEALGALVARIAARADEVLALRRRALRADVAAELARILGERAPLPLRLAGLCRHAASRVGRGVATLWWREGSELRLAATSLAGGALGAAACLAEGEGVDGEAARKREAVFLRRGARLCYAALPLLAGTELLGVLAVQPGSDALESPDEEHELLEIAAAAAALLERELRAERAEARATRGEALHEATLRLLAESDPDRIAESVASSAALLLDAEHAIVRALDPERRSFRVRAHFGGAGPLDGALLELDRRLAREALRRRAPIESADAAGSGDDDARPCLVAPLVHGGRALGSLAVYDKRPPAGPAFDALDRELVQRLAAIAARALATALPAETAPPAAMADDGFLSFEQFAARIDQELARAAAQVGDAHAFALVTCRIENWDELPPAAAARVERATAMAFASQLRSFDVATRTTPGGFCALLPAPGAAASEHVARLARAVSEAVAKDDAEAPHVALAFGSALHAEAGETRADLLARAAEARIRML